MEGSRNRFLVSHVAEGDELSSRRRTGREQAGCRRWLVALISGIKTTNATLFPLTIFCTGGE